VAVRANVDRDDDALSQGPRDEIFDALLAVAEPVFGAVFGEQREAFEVAEAVVGYPNDLAWWIRGHDRGPVRERGAAA
jgi:hypothetical protein